MFGLGNVVKRLNLDKESQSFLGVDIGTSSIKVVQLKKEKERAILETYGEIAIGPYMNVKVGQAVKLTEEKLEEALRDLIREASVKARMAIVGVPLRSSFVTTISLPPGIEGDIGQIVSLEARRYIPVPIGEVALDWWIIPHRGHEGEGGTDSEDKQKITQVLLVATHKDVIERYGRVISKINLKPNAYEIESFSTIRSSIGRETAPITIMDMGASTTKISVVDYGIVRYSHLIDKGAQDLTVALSQSLGIPFERAETMKREAGLSKDSSQREVTSVMEPILEYIFYEAGNVIREYQRKDKHTIGRMIILGGGSLLIGLADFAVKRLSIEVNLSDPFSKVEYPAVFENVLKKVGPSFAVAVGLALRDL